jgi:ABC-2 type transport system permease protein
MIVGGTSVHALGTSFGVMLLVFALLLGLASKLYPGLAR